MVALENLELQWLKMAADDKQIIPTPDTSGSANTQEKGHHESTVSIELASPISMGQVVNGLAMESNSGLNRQSSIITSALLKTQNLKLESAEKRVTKLLPENAELKVENRFLKRGRKKGALFNSLGVVMISVGSALAVGPIFSTAGAVTFGAVFAAGAALIVFGIILQTVIILTSLTGND